MRVSVCVRERAVHARERLVCRRVWMAAGDGGGSLWRRRRASVLFMKSGAVSHSRRVSLI